MNRSRRFFDYLSHLEHTYSKRFPLSSTMYTRSSEYFPNSISNPARSFKPFPIFVKSASGGEVTTLEDQRLLDFWQGHFCNVLGHDHPIIRRAVCEAYENGLGLQLGMCTELELSLASLLRSTCRLETFVFTTAGTLATMYAVLLGLAYTRKRLVVKVSGGWHGAHPWSLKGVRYPRGINSTVYEGAGIPKSLGANVLTIPFDDIDALDNCFRKHGNAVGVCITELVLGNSGMVMASRAWVRRLRELTASYGTVLVFDEMVTGFRLNCGGLHQLYDVYPDLVAFGKAMTGGMPFACVGGDSKIMAMASTAKCPRVWADSGTFVSHPATLCAAIATVNFLRDNPSVFSHIVASMDRLRAAIGAIFTEAHIPVHITGQSADPDIPDFPIGTIRFIDNIHAYDYENALMHWDTRINDIFMRDTVCKISLLLKGVYSWQGLGVVTLSHTLEDLDRTIIAYRAFAAELRDLDLEEEGNESIERT